MKEFLKKAGNKFWKWIKVFWQDIVYTVKGTGSVIKDCYNFIRDGFAAGKMKGVAGIFKSLFHIIFSILKGFFVGWHWGAKIITVVVLVILFVPFPWEKQDTEMTDANEYVIAEGTQEDISGELPSDSEDVTVPSKEPEESIAGEEVDATEDVQNVRPESNSRLKLFIWKDSKNGVSEGMDKAISWNLTDGDSEDYFEIFYESYNSKYEGTVIKGVDTMYQWDNESDLIMYDTYEPFLELLQTGAEVGTVEYCRGNDEYNSITKEEVLSRLQWSDIPSDFVINGNQFDLSDLYRVEIGSSVNEDILHQYLFMEFDVNIQQEKLDEMLTLVAEEKEKRNTVATLTGSAKQAVDEKGNILWTESSLFYKGYCNVSDEKFESDSPLNNEHCPKLYAAQGKYGDDVEYDYYTNHFYEKGKGKMTEEDAYELLPWDEIPQYISMPYYDETIQFEVIGLKSVFYYSEIGDMEARERAVGYELDVYVPEQFLDAGR